MALYIYPQPAEKTGLQRKKMEKIPKRSKQETTGSQRQRETEGGWLPCGFNDCTLNSGKAGCLLGPGVPRNFPMYVWFLLKLAQRFWFPDTSTSWTKVIYTQFPSVTHGTKGPGAQDGSYLSSFHHPASHPHWKVYPITHKASIH